MNYKSIIEESHILNNIDKITSILNLSTQASKERLIAQINEWSSTPYIQTAKIAGLAEVIKKSTQSPHTQFEKIAAIEKELIEETPKYTCTDSIKDGSLELLYFRGNHTWHLNFIPFFLAIWCNAKKYLFPAFQLLMPLMIIIAPYLLLKYVMRLPLSFSNYFGLIRQLYLGNAQFSLDNLFEFAKSVIQLAGFAITLVQSSIQSIQHARHLRTVETNILHFGELIESYITQYEELRSTYKTQYNIQLQCTGIPVHDSPRLTALWCIQYPRALTVLQQIIGKIELQWRIAASTVNNTFAIPLWDVSASKPRLLIKDAGELSMHGTMKPISIRLLGHSILTGPNRGGKSTALRAILQNIIMAHTIGAVNARSITLTPLGFVHSCLRLEDKPGHASLFEREIEWAVDSLEMAANQFGFICIDELFHGTNPRDSLIASRIYLDKLWARSNIISIVSTHQFDLLDGDGNTTNKEIQYYCCPAFEGDTDNHTLNYMYGLEPGVCRLSSVYDILQEKGLGISALR